MSQFIVGHWWALVLFGVVVGVFAGLTGTGGGLILVPIFVLLFGFTQKAAQGTSLAMILSPASIPALLNYQGARAIHWYMVWTVAPGMFVGSYFGSKLAVFLPQQALKLTFAFVLIYVAGYMIFSQLPSAGGALLLACVPAAVTVALALYTGVFHEVAAKVKAEPPAAVSPEPPTTHASD